MADEKNMISLNSDQQQKKKAKKKFRITHYNMLEELGKGSYGSVHKIVHRENPNLIYACKNMDLSDHQFKSTIMESLLLNTTQIRHPHLLYSHHVVNSKKEWKIYVIQDLAITDLMKLTRHANENEAVLSVHQIENYSRQILLALDFLHQNEFIHCDLKASNVLLFPGDIVKLADFSVSVCSYMQNRGIALPYVHTVSTPTHKPIEVLKNIPWNKSIDVWCFGCTLYEITYGMKLFPGQNRKKLDQNSLKIENEKEKERKEMLVRLRSIHCIIDWAIRNGQTDISRHLYPEQPNDNYKKALYAPNYFDPKYKFINQMIHRCLNVNEMYRIGVPELLSNFSGVPSLPKDHYQTLYHGRVCCTSEKVSQFFNERDPQCISLKNKLSPFLSYNLNGNFPIEIINYGNFLYQKYLSACKTPEKLSEKKILNIAFGCLFIAAHILMHLKGEPSHEMEGIMMHICQTLDYQFF